MADFSAVAKLEEMKAVIAECEKEAARFDKGIKTSGTRLRKSMQQIKALAQEIQSSNNLPITIQKLHHSNRKKQNRLSSF